MSQREDQQIIANRAFDESFPGTQELITKYEVFVAQEAYTIDRADYQTLRASGSDSTLRALAINIIAAVILSAITMVIKVVLAARSKSDINIELWELLLLIAALVISLIMLFIGSKMSSERKTLLQKIAQHFDTSPRTLSAKRKK